MACGQTGTATLTDAISRATLKMPRVFRPAGRSETCQGICTAVVEQSLIGFWRAPVSEAFVPPLKFARLACPGHERPRRAQPPAVIVHLTLHDRRASQAELMSAVGRFDACLMVLQLACPCPAAWRFEDATRDVLRGVGNRPPEWGTAPGQSEVGRERWPERPAHRKQLSLACA
jgi:hypothetical protein